ncbi:hybrid sensor histidine kinase/response regulator [Pararoseomonas indoligenes]|uniref:histidine kinase n=1 Tax=Roseomonas indoligenes TaxID=2820811 RepID=A0A940S6S2_9PROT|nr:PAS domain-containing sensor histidine kinase [Pararoseomonas indoligenes]MBP0492342.1 PAS domain S-box protein [Pararoseomonas indoligenes]
MNPARPSLASDSYELLIQGVVDYAIYMLDPTGVVVSWNPGAERIKGYAAEEVIGTSFSRFYTEEDRAVGMPDRALRTAVEEGRFTAEAWRIRKDGSRFWAMVVIDPIRRGGALIGFAKVTRDMTEQRAAQMEALETERRFRLLVQGVHDYAIYMLGPEGQVTNWNTGAERIKGYAAGEIVGQHFSRFYTEEDAAAGVPHRALETARREGRYEAEGWRRRKDGTRFWAGVVIDAIRDEAGELIGFAKVTRDLTERRETQIQLEQSREQLFQAQKMEALGQLTGGLAHDFNNMLAGISGSLELLRTRIAEGRVGEADRYIAAALGASSRAAALTHRLLAFARRQTLDPKPTDAHRLIEDMGELVQRTVGPAIEVRKALQPDLWVTLCDPNQLENALLNLCINARDAMPEGGTLTVGTENLSLAVEAAQARGLLPGDYVSVNVSDTGVGMAPEVLERAFDPFFTTKPLGQGTGLGLSMVYGFARQSGGQVRIRSAPGEGTAITIQLPRHLAALETDEAAAGPGESPRARAGETVLIVDDEETVRMLVAEVLQDLGYTALEAADGPSGLEILRSSRRIDLLVTDVGLPGGLNGRQLADAARTVRPGLRVLFITGYAETAAVGDRLDPGMHVMTKPFGMEALATRIKAIIAGG